MAIELIHLSASQFDLLPKDKTVFFFPVGPLEDHGSHLPMGADAHEALRLCQLAAENLEKEMQGWVGVIMPVVPLGIDSNTTRLAITVRPHVLRDWLVDASQSLIRLGFFHFVCFSGHLGPRQLTAIEEAGMMIRRRERWKRWLPFSSRFRSRVPSLISASSAFTSVKEVLASPFWPDPAEHGGKRDTSVILAIAPEKVDLCYQGLPVMQKDDSRWMRNWKRRKGALASYWGSPAEADANWGQQEISRLISGVFPKMRAVWEGADPNFLFRSWYSILPPNKSFFRAWLLVIAILCLMCSWVLWNLPGNSF